MYRLSAMALAVPMLHKPFSKPSVLLALLRQKVKTSSTHPDTTKRNQFITSIFAECKFPHSDLIPLLHVLKAVFTFDKFILSGPGYGSD